jgi:phospholipase/carboxylesterase
LRGSAGFDESDLCDQLKLLHVAGQDVELRQYPGTTEMPAKVLADVNRWIMNKISSSII